MVSNSAQIENAILATLPLSPRPTETIIREKVESFRTIFPISDADAEMLLKRLHDQLTITMDGGFALLREDYKPWLSDRKIDIIPDYWERFRKLLIKTKWPPLVVNSLDAVSDTILDLAGDPKLTGTWNRKGLIVGDVQSGKTAMYTAVCCKAADAGYKLIILLTGTIESLRRQTQERLDEGFVGRDSLESLRSRGKLGTDLKVGVGLIDGRRFATVFTSRTNDFSISIANAAGLSLKNSSETILLVCKKNTKILENLRIWLEMYNAVDGSIQTPLLLIDDEADSASVNTNAIENDVTRTNREIRRLLKLFERNSYLGVTATPFANVFILPDSETDELGEDLFPKDYIYSLEAPINYHGPAAIFDEAGVDEAFLRNFDDIEEFLPVSHKSTHLVQALPESLDDAVCCFLLASTIRDLRNEGPTHRSMLVNVSRFTNVQDQVAVLIDVKVRDVQREVRLYSALDEVTAIKNSAHIRKLRDIWLREYTDCGFTWHAIQAALPNGISSITVTAVNQRSGASGVDYKSYRETGLRVIAVGGNSLSRGLTLEGLCVSYFYRNSKMYDTLLQMGRWFGYRIGYEDLCRLWITDDAANWYSHITTATVELRAEIKKMRQRQQRPIDFGLRVRTHKDSLIITARNKMRSARDFVHFVSISGKNLETVRLRPEPEINHSNFSAAEELLSEAKLHGTRVNAPIHKNWYVWQEVPKAAVAVFLSKFKGDPLNFDFQIAAVSSFVAENHADLSDLWDVALVSVEDGNPLNPSTNICELVVQPVKRGYTTDMETGSILVSGRKARVGSGDDESEGLTRALLAEIKERAQSEGFKNTPSRMYREVRSRPLIILYLIRGFLKNADTEKPLAGKPLVAFSLSFPIFTEASDAERVAYKVNPVEWKSLFGNIDEPDDDLSGDD